ncbi:MAG: ATP synthase F1 subunit epsilon [Lachnospiraceae bacterium]|nr:ATP synthase F1 subunit epsilon [Lachnospiraceae bacterium]
MGASFNIRIIATDKIFYEGSVRAFIGTTIDGEFEYLSGHEEEIVALSEGILKYQTQDGEWHKGISGRGTAQFANNRCTILVDTCEKPEDIDRKRAQEALDRAKERLRQHHSQVEYYMTQASLARALTRLKETYED